MKKLFMAAILLGLLGMILVFHWNAAEVEANDSMKMNDGETSDGMRESHARMHPSTRYC